ncbi:protein fem-1 homolog B isoform X2 [Lucilia sericata]|uniref:protein fem-1 homolog B isoform X2 n=1 Tax=Lucilia sericata TaxID=13632 RepID=UPI0018A870B6|nr:protein fem-1 homolog B isoform X2 [Lucilia sericata]
MCSRIQSFLDSEFSDLDIHTRIMIEELTEEVQQLFPNETKVLPSLLTVLYSTAKLNHAKQLVATMNDIRNPELRDYLLNLKFDEIDGQSVTPLTMAAMAGNTMYVKTLLSHYNIDLERECNVIFDGLVVYGATALWVAAGLGHLQVVKLLVNNGANINHNTKAQSSPLRAACYDGRLDIVKYLIEHGADVNLGNKYNNTCIMIAAYKGHAHVVDTLLKNGANPNEQALCGATALHYAAECGHIEVCRILLDHGARLQENEHGLTPVLNAAERTHEEVVHLFINRPGLMKKEDIIIALELLGASFANDKDNYSIQKAYTHLMRAMEMRYSDSEKIIKKRIIPPELAYDNWLETENIPELQAIRLNHHSIHMESLTIRERILGKNNPDLPQPIVYRGAVMADQGRFSQCQTLWNYAMDLRMMNNVSVERDLLRFAQLFSQILRIEDVQLDLSQVLSVLVKCQLEIERNKYKIGNPGPKDVPQMIADQNEQNVASALYLIKIITKVLAQQPQYNKEHIDLLYNTIKKFIKCDTRLADGQTLLHMAVNGVTPVDDFFTSDVCKFPCFRTALLLVHAGASVIAMDELRNTPLHTLVASFPRDNPHLLPNAEKIVKLLVDAGAHLDAINAQGLTPAQVAHVAGLRNIILGYENSLTSLKCIASRCIAVNKIKYQGLVPTALESYIQIHSAEKFFA